MKCIGIIAEYNPFHNGHLYHLNKAKKMFKDAVIVLVLGGNFTQRGDVSILDKWTKTKIALTAGADLVIELPFPFSVASSDIFAEGAMEICHALGVSDIVFGSETEDIEGMEKLVDIELNDPCFPSLVQVYLRTGYNYPTSLSLALKDLTGKSFSLPNDILGLSYIKAIKKFNYSIHPHTIKRTNAYHEETLQEEIASATSIRKALTLKQDVSNVVPSFVEKYLKGTLPILDNYFPLIKYKIMTEENLEKYPFIDSGMAKKLKAKILTAQSVDDLINQVKSKNTTYSKLSRSFIYILCNFTKEQRDEYRHITYLRLLGFSKKGRNYLNEKKKEISLPIISKFSREKDEMLALEHFVTKVYSLGFPKEAKVDIIEQEYKKFPIRKDEEND